MEEQNIRCQIWAFELAGSGFQHKCHARAAGLAGNAYPPQRITKLLLKTRTWDETGLWRLEYCKPKNHNGDFCKNCRHSYARQSIQYADPRELVFE